LAIPRRRSVLLSLACLASTLVSSSASAHRGTDEKQQQAEQDLGQENEPMNAVGFGFAYVFHALKSREGADGSETPDSELLAGITIAYERVLIVNWLKLTIAKPIYWGRNRFDSPIELVLTGTYRKNNWEPFLGMGFVSNIHLFEGEREESEGARVEYTFGFGPTLGFAYFIRKHWGVAFELSYAFIPHSNTFEHEVGNSITAGYFF
jgi:hypothetical protein